MYILFYCIQYTHFVEVVQYLFGIPGVKFVLSDRFSQDPLEKYFGNQLQRGGTNENPNVQQMVHNASALRALKSVTPEFPACNQSEILTAVVLQTAFLGVGCSPHSLPPT